MFTTMQVRDGRTLEYVDLGDPAGTPALFFHGTPATAGQAAVVAEAARRNGVRLVAATRPGYAASSISPPGLAASAPDTLELADHLGVQSFAVVGTSGGGPFALAVAAAAPDRVTVAAVLGGPGSCSEVKPEVLEDDDRRALALLADGEVDEAMRITIETGDRDLGGLRALSAAEFSAAMQKMAPPGEDWFDRHPDRREAFESDFRRAVTSSDGYARDNLSWLGAWDVDLTAITATVRLVYGESDRMAEPAHGEWLQQRLPSSELHLVPGGHGDATFGAAEDTLALL